MTTLGRHADYSQHFAWPDLVRIRATLRLVIASLFLIPSATQAQEFRPGITGQVSDPSGAVIAGAKVVATRVERKVGYEATTNSFGRYDIQFLPPGKYEVYVEKDGFKRVVLNGISLLTGDRLALNVRLELGVVAESVTATAETTVLQTEMATRQVVTENRILETVPSGGRNLFALQYDQPGVVKTSPYWGSMELYAFSNVNSVSIGGGRSGENEITVDGLTDTKSDRGVAFVPPLAATQEFTVQTNSYDAQFGRVGGGVTMISLKSGTNALHGQLFEFFKNDKLRASDWVDNKNGDPKSPYKNNTFGFELGGPVFIPKIVDGRNRIFFLLSFEGLREHDPGGQVRTLPTADMLKGDFSHLLNGNGNLVTIYDPLSTRLGPDGTTYLRTAFPSNIIPIDRINSVAAKVASFYPAPDLPGDGPALQNNYQKILPQKNGYDSWLGKMDFALGPKSRISFGYGQTPWLTYSKLLWGNNVAEPSNAYPSTRVFRNGSADLTYILTPALALDLRAGVARFETFTGNSFGANYDPSQLGFPQSLVSQFTSLIFPRFNIGSYSEIGSQGVRNYNAQDVLSLQPSLSWNHGRHLVKIGMELRRYDDNNLNPGLASGSYSFDAGWTQANPQRSDSNSGNAFASFLLGYPSSGAVDHNIDPAFRSHYSAFYAQDDFKVHPRLTLSLGLRWDYESPRVERYNRMIRGFAFDQPSPIASAVKASPAASNCPACAAGLTGGLLFATNNGDERYAFDPHKLNFQPRFGIAYRITSRFVFRGGYGLSYLGQSSSGQTAGFSQQTQLISSTDNGLTPAVSLLNPYPTSLFPSGLLRPIGNSEGLATNLGQAIAFQYRDRPLPYSQQYSAGFQFELPGQWLVDASYVGNLTKRLPETLVLNFIPLDILNSIPVDQRQAYFNQQVANPMAGLLPSSSFNGPLVPRQQLLFAFPQYGSGTEVTDVPIGRQRYDSAQMKLAHRFAQGLALTVSYTISKSLEQTAPLNPQDVDLTNLLDSKLEKRLTQFDVPQQLSVIGSYDLPIGRGRHFGSSMSRIANAFFGGWTFSGVFMSHSGFPLPFPNAAPLEAKSAALSDRERDALAQKAGRSQYDPSYDVWFDTSLFPHVAQAPFTLRTFPTIFPDVRGKPLNVADISLYKEFTIHDKVKWQIRCDAHNVANFPWFASLDANGANVASPLFGHLKADIGNETRVIVGVMKLMF